MKRVVITGAGTINAIGKSVPETLEAMREGRCGIAEVETRDLDRLGVRIGGQVKGFEPEAMFNRQQMALYDRFTQFTLTAAREAIAQSGLEFRGELSARALATGRGELAERGGEWLELTGRRWPLPVHGPGGPAPRGDPSVTCDA